MRFCRADGQQVDGVVWCPGPVARSVWVLTASGPVAVKLPTTPEPDAVIAADVGLGDHEEFREVQIAHRDPLHPRRPVTWKPYEMPSIAELSARTTAAQLRRLAARAAPPLSEDDWQDALFENE